MKNEMLLGIDLGTSSIKAILTNLHGTLLAAASREYPIHSPQPGWAEQDPQDWWQAAQSAVQQASSQADGKILGIGFSGQMHGTILLSKEYRPLAPAIIWADSRSSLQVQRIQQLIGYKRFIETTGTAPAAGFMGSTLMWFKQNQPSLLDNTHIVLLPKDYLRFLMTGEIACEPSDASSTALFDIQQRTWSMEIIQELGLPERIFPKLVEPAQVCGSLIQTAAEQLGLPPGIPVVAGCADQAAQALGNGLLKPGKGSITLGSGGQIFIPIKRPLPKPDPRLHIFCHAPPERWYILGAMLTAGLSLRWLRDILGFPSDPNAYTKLSRTAATISPGSDGLLFLPYLSGERTPLMDPSARSAFIGLTLHHSQAHLARAVMEGVAYALRHILETIESVHNPGVSFLASGNSLSDPVWRGIVCDIIRRPLTHSNQVESAGRGAALLAGIGAGIFQDHDDLIHELIHLNSGLPETTEPVAAISNIYESHYQRFLEAHPKTKPLARSTS